MTFKNTNHHTQDITIRVKLTFRFYVIKNVLKLLSYYLPMLCMKENLINKNTKKITFKVY